jgi:hypothetical protein
MTPTLQVLLLESHPSTGNEAAAALAAAGHEVFRCHDALSPGFPCVGLTDRAKCPLRIGVDVAVDVRRNGYAEPTTLESGVGCALRDGVPVVELGDGTSEMSPWLIPGGDDVVVACETAAAQAFDELKVAIADRLRPLYVANGIDAGLVDCEIERDGRSLFIHLIGPPANSGMRQAASVRAYDVVRESRRVFGEIRIGYRTVLPHHAPTP